MITCPNCKLENDPDKRREGTCARCGYNLYAPEPVPEPDPEEAQRLRERIKELEAQVIKLGQELEEFNQSPKPLDDHPIVHQLRQEVASKAQLLAEKESRILEHIGEIERLRNLVHLPKPGPGTEIAIDSFPDANPDFHLVLDGHTDSIDLASTRYSIRANLERTADGLQIVVHTGATVNIRPSQKGIRWTRFNEGDRVPVDAGTIFFDPRGTRNARLTIKV